MKAITLHQPWAQLVALGVKTIETRSWPAPKGLIGQRIAIHAAATTKGVDAIASGTEGGWCYADFGDGDSEWQAAYCYRTSDEGTRGDTYLHDLRSSMPGPMPLGAVVASAVLTDCVPMSVVPMPYGAHAWLWVPPGRADLNAMVDGGLYETCARDYADQLPFGDFAPGRWAWLLDDIAPLYPPIPARGAQRIWNWTPERSETDQEAQP